MIDIRNNDITNLAISLQFERYEIYEGFSPTITYPIDDVEFNNFNITRIFPPPPPAIGVWRPSGRWSQMRIPVELLPNSDNDESPKRRRKKVKYLKQS